jgi:hypothetical protein
MIMATERMDVYSKLDFIKDAGLGTSGLITKLEEQTDSLEKLLSQLVEHRSKESDNLGGRSSDSKRMKQIESEISAKPPLGEGGKKLSGADKDLWLMKELSVNPEYKKALDAHKMAEFVIDDLEGQIKIAETKIGNIRSVINLRTSQLAFFAGDVLISIDDPEN